MSKHDFQNAARGGCDASRRAFVSNLARGLLGVTAGGMIGGRIGAQTLGQPLLTLAPRHEPAQQVIYLFLRGGMSHLDTLDPKPGAATQGPTEAIRTRADGVQLSQHFPLLADQMDKACIISSMTSTQGAHQQAQYMMRTSYEKRGTIQHASLGAWHNRIVDRQNSTLPGHVIVGGAADMPSAGFFPPQYAALPIGSAESGLQNSRRPRGVTERRFQDRLERLAKMNQTFSDNHPQREVKAYGEMYADAVRLMRSNDLAAFDIAEEPEAMRQAYGADEDFGAGCLLARRLVEHGVRFVEVVSNGWDTHADNFDRIADLTPAIDRGLAALLADLEGRGLLRQTLVVLASEFGRTPDIDQDQGRNHYPKAFSCLLAGGGVRGGPRFGKTDKEGREVIENDVTIPDFNATIAYGLGIPLDRQIVSDSGRPFTVADKGYPVTELFG
ncbi:MAG: DUF1501 domain-containing protein [Planctomycetota bacterium]|nr:DUF1501 domain-containing protein [Planctomycetota bacterium]